ncbi:MAG TPA: hypothetical protein VEA69_22445, partial [Tepidisphaeraceae bacterium]|nr:hypothetical protein [Tepidisphaeraceae bacterium]
TQEIHLLNDSPVDIPDRSDVRQEAERLLSRMKDLLLLTKGGNQGKTPKEWSILLTRLPLVKQSFLKRSLDPMRADAALEEILEYVESGEGRQYRIDDVIGEEKIRVLCREVDRAVTEKQSG